MALKTGCMEWTRIPHDGYRICIMSRTTDDTGRNPSVNYAKAEGIDCWLPHLAPPGAAVNDLHQGRIELPALFDIYRHHMTGIRPRREMQKVINQAFEEDVTVLCSEIYARICHRSVFVELCRAAAPDLSIILPSELEERSREKIELRFASLLRDEEIPRRSRLAKQERPEIE